MSRAMQIRHLEQAERHVALGVKHIADQERIIAKMTRLGYDTTQATQLLTNFHASQALHVAHRDRIVLELAAK